MYENVYQHLFDLCIFKRLGNNLFTYGDRIDDYNIETLIRSSSSVNELIECLDNRILDHECVHCQEYTIKKSVKRSGSVDNVRFVKKNG